MGRSVRIAVGAFVACVALSGCGPKLDDPPTDDEIFKVFSSFWTDHARDWSKISAAPFETYLQPDATHKSDDGITRSDPTLGTVYAVTVKITYRALQPLVYRCDERSRLGIDIWPAGTRMSAPEIDHEVTTGDLLTCNAGTSYTKIKEGWIYDASIGVSYVIRR